jgi:hypothetical protein
VSALCSNGFSFSVISLIVLLDAIFLTGIPCKVSVVVASVLSAVQDYDFRGFRQSHQPNVGVPPRNKQDRPLPNPYMQFIITNRFNSIVFCS